MCSVKLKSTAMHNSSSEKLPASKKTGEAPEICTAHSGSAPFGHVVSANWPPEVMPFIVGVRILSTFSDNCVQIRNCREEGSLRVADVSAPTSVFEMQH